MSLNPTAAPFLPNPSASSPNEAVQEDVREPSHQTSGPKPSPGFIALNSCYLLSPLYTSGKVIMGRPMDGEHSLVAVKLYRPDESGLATLRKEIEILHTLQGEKGHHNVPQCLASIDETECPALVMTLYGENLFAFQDRFPDRALPDQILLPLVDQLLRGLDWMHRLGVVHRDLRSRHIMITGSERPTVKIIDYTSALLLPHAEAPYHGGCLYYRPPDVHLGNIAYEGDYDIWSLGCLICEMLTGRLLFQDATGADLVDVITSTLDFCEAKQAGLRDLPWTHRDAIFTADEAMGWRQILGGRYSQRTATYLTAFLQFDPEERITACQALEWLPLLVETPRH